MTHAEYDQIGRRYTSTRHPDPRIGAAILDALGDADSVVDARDMHVAPGFVVMGAGFGLAMPQVTSLSMRAAPQEHAGAASGFVGTTQQAGGALGLAVVATVAAGSGRTAGFLVAAGALLAGALVALYLTAQARPRHRPDVGPRPSAAPRTPTLERC